MSKLAADIVGDTKCRQDRKKLNLVFIGSSSTPANSPIKGHMRCPTNKKIIRAI